ncbi:hypothetical protein AA0111_g12863 [Alternaria arborescens]|uniref:hypothetical protein n=1 Tax=Alternaria arborescens TaxID=156630 RepID=UPI0010751321|nr:hypothetical protein AA0111_g12863 [Alternaria arborescens]RYO10991.1 hypothetical protein AA0111_g12863 [Alternaria arborescens]
MDGEWESRGYCADMIIPIDLNHTSLTRDVNRPLHDTACRLTNTMQPTLARMGPPKYAQMPNHPIHIHPVRPLYRFMATGLGASMWFFLMYRAKKDGPALLGWKHPWDH